LEQGCTAMQANNVLHDDPPETVGRATSKMSAG
jgi:hypothetical protein